MLKLVRYIDYSGNYAYAPPDKEAVINTDDIQRIAEIARENRRRSDDDICRIKFKDGSWLDVIGKPSDFVESDK